MKRSLISLLVAGLFAGTATIVLAADPTTSDPNQVKSDNNAADTSQSRAAEPTKREAMNDGAAAKNDTHEAKAENSFKRADKDNDGTLDRKEARHFNKHAAKNFDAIDTDKDGTISWDEYNSWMAANPAHKKGNM